MHALVVVTHPAPTSLTRRIADRLAEGVRAADPAHTTELADLHAEGFDPRFTARDLQVHDREAPPTPDVLAEQARVDRADALVLVHPVYWWSMPAMLKGWIDRAFCNGWAYDFDASSGRVIKALGRLRVHLVGLAGADARTYDRHGYGAAMRAQIEHGIFDYCGARVVTSTRLHVADGRDESAHLAKAYALGLDLFDAQRRYEAGGPASESA